jgi:hypothetical protein
LFIYPIHADSKSELDLYEKAYNAYKNRNFIEASQYFRSYIEKNSESMQYNPVHAQGVKTALNHCLDELKDDKLKLAKLDKQIRELESELHKCKYNTDQGIVRTFIIRKKPLVSLKSVKELDSIQKKPKSYLLVCRGGGKIFFYFTSEKGKSRINISIGKGTQKVGKYWEHRNTLLPGTCAWLDRKVGGNEPNIILLTGIESFHISWGKDGVIRRLGSQLKFLRNLFDPHKFQSFYVYNNGKGRFVVTKIGKSL